MCYPPNPVDVIYEDDEGNLFIEDANENLITAIESIITVNDNKLDLSKDIEFKVKELSKEECDNRGEFIMRILLSKYSDDDEWVEIKEINVANVGATADYHEFKEEKNLDSLVSIDVIRVDVDVSWHVLI